MLSSLQPPISKKTRIAGTVSTDSFVTESTVPLPVATSLDDVPIDTLKNILSFVGKNQYRFVAAPIEVSNKPTYENSPGIKRLT